LTTASTTVGTTKGARKEFNWVCFVRSSDYLSEKKLKARMWLLRCRKTSSTTTTTTTTIGG